MRARLAPFAAATGVVAIVATASVSWPDGQSGSNDAARTIRRDLPTVEVHRRDVTPQVSRGADGGRPPATDLGGGQGAAGVRQVASRPVPPPAGHRFLTAPLNVRTGPGDDFTMITVLPESSRVAITKATKGAWAQILLRGATRWVHAEYLSARKPVAARQPSGAPGQTSTGGESAPTISSAPCASGSSVEVGLTPDAIGVHRSVCARFPGVTAYGGLRSDGEHGEGRALDIMVSSSTLGDAIAAWVRANSSPLGVSEVLWAQHIWTVQRSSEGWRLFADRGSVTANHYDHVHVTVYGNSGG